MILGYQILMIFNDFGGPGANFFMIFGILSARGPFSAQGSDFYDFGDLCHAKGYLVLGIIFNAFWKQFL